jgi:hypothetical protein
MQPETNAAEARVQTHELKTWPRFFDEVLSGAKTFEARLDDRGFQVGDGLVLREWAPGEGYTGRETRRVVSYVLRGGQFGIVSGHAVLALSQQGQVPALAAGDVRDDKAAAEQAGMTGQGWSAARRVFEAEARAYGAADRYEMASAIADRAPEKIVAAALAASPAAGPAVSVEERAKAAFDYRRKANGWDHQIAWEDLMPQERAEHIAAMQAADALTPKSGGQG